MGLVIGMFMGALLIIPFVVFMALTWWHGLMMIFAASPVLGWLSLLIEGSQNIEAIGDWFFHVDLALQLAQALHLHG